MELYPDLERLGGLGPAVGAEISARGSTLRVCPLGGDTGPFGYARAVSAGRSSDLSISTDARRFPLAPLARAAHDHPVLRSPMPFTSMSWLCFSRCTGYPFDIVGLCAAPDGQGGFRLGRRDAPTVAAASIEDTIDLIFASLPEGVGSAHHGTADSS